MDNKLEKELHAVAHDDRSGATELTWRSAKALQAWLGRRPKPTELELLQIARALLRAQPSMAPMLRLANEVALSIDQQLPGPSLRRTVSRLQAEIRRGPDRIAALLHKRLKQRRHWKIGAYSYSRTVAAALARSRASIEWVQCSEGRPSFEGRMMAEHLVRAGIPVRLVPDAAFLEQEARFQDVQVLGADAVTPAGFVNKMGSKIIVSEAGRGRRPVIVLADTMKFWPESPAHSTRFWMWTFGDPRQVWRDAPRNVRVHSPLFSCVPFARHVRILTERGWMAPHQIRSELKRIRLSPRLQSLAD